MNETLEGKLASAIDYMYRLRNGEVSRQDDAMHMFLDDPEVAEWLTRMNKTGRVSNTRFSSKTPK